MASREPEHCQNCRFFYHARGTCRRHAPTRSENYNGLFPYVLSGEWCGDWELKKDEKGEGRVERAAKRLHSEQCDYEYWCDLHEDLKDKFRSCARAVLEAAEKEEEADGE